MQHLHSIPLGDYPPADKKGVCGTGLYVPCVGKDGDRGYVCGTDSGLKNRNSACGSDYSTAPQCGSHPSTSCGSKKAPERDIEELLNICLESYGLTKSNVPKYKEDLTKEYVKKFTKATCACAEQNNIKDESIQELCQAMIDDEKQTINNVYDTMVSQLPSRPSPSPSPSPNSPSESAKFLNLSTSKGRLHLGLIIGGIVIVILILLIILKR